MRSSHIAILLGLAMLVIIWVIAQRHSGVDHSATTTGNAPVDDEGGTVFAFLALNTNRAPAAATLFSAMQDVLADHKVTPYSVGNPPKVGPVLDHANVTLFLVDEQVCMVAMIDNPIPWTDLVGPCATSWRWREATEVMQRHGAHLIVSVLGDAGDRLDRALLLSRIMVGCIRTHDAAGVFWGGGGGVVNSPEAFADEALAADRQDLPVALWIDFRIQYNGDETWNVITQGLDEFGCMEIELLSTRQDVNQALYQVMGVATILLWGERIPDGDTVGPEDDDSVRIKTTHEDSVWDRPGKVLRIHW